MPCCVGSQHRKFLLWSKSSTPRIRASLICQFLFFCRPGRLGTALLPSPSSLSALLPGRWTTACGSVYRPTFPSPTPVVGNGVEEGGDPYGQVYRWGYTPPGSVSALDCVALVVHHVLCLGTLLRFFRFVAVLCGCFCCVLFRVVVFGFRLFFAGRRGGGSYGGRCWPVTA